MLAVEGLGLVGVGEPDKRKDIILAFCRLAGFGYIIVYYFVIFDGIARGVFVGYALVV